MRVSKNYLKKHYWSVAPRYAYPKLSISNFSWVIWVSRILESVWLGSILGCSSSFSLTILASYLGKTSELEKGLQKLVTTSLLSFLSGDNWKNWFLMTIPWTECSYWEFLHLIVNSRDVLTNEAHKYMRGKRSILFQETHNFTIKLVQYMEILTL